MHETASIRSHHARLLWTEVSASAFDEVGSRHKPNTIVATPIEQDNFVKKYLSCFIVQVWCSIQIFKEIQDF